MYLFGSRVYGTAREDSDYDVRMIGSFSFDGIEEVEQGNIDVTIVPMNEFVDLVDIHEGNLIIA